MSEFIAEAQVLVRPNTAAFRAQLQAQLTAATKGIVVPIAVSPVAAKGVAEAAVATGALATESKAAAASTLQLAGAQKTLSVATAQSTASLLGAASATSRLNAGLLGLRSAIGGSATIGLGALALGAIVAGKALRAAIQGAAQLEQELNFFQATANATVAQMEEVAQAARDLGRDASLPAVSANDAAEALTNLARAGLSVDDSIAGARGALQLSAAAQISVADATNLTASALNTFSLEGTQATHVADLLTGASVEAQGEITDMGLALQQSGAAAKLAGVSIEDTVALITLLAKNGLRGSDAGTSLRTAFIALANPTKKAQALIEALNLQITDLNGNLRPEIFADFNSATAAMGNVQRLAAAKVLFGADALRAAGLAGEEGVGGLDAMRASTDEAGRAAAIAGARTKGFAGDVNALSSNLETLGTTLGGTVTPILSSFTRGLNLGISLINDFISNPLPFGTVAEAAKASFESLNEQIAETQRQIDSFGGRATAPPALVQQLDSLNEKLQNFRGGMRDSNLGLAEFIDRTNEAAAAALKLSNAIAPLGQRLQLGLAVAQAQGNQGQELTILRQLEERQQEFLDATLSRRQTGKNVALAQKAAENLDQTRNQIQAILDSEAAANKSAATEAERAAKDAQDARNKQFEALADAFGGRQNTIEDKIARAGIADNTQKQINLTKALIASFQKELAALRERAAKLKISNDVRKRIQAAIIAAIREARLDILRFQKEQAENVKEFSTPAIDLRIRIAQARDNVAAEIRLRRERLALISKELAKLKNAGKKNTLAWLDLKAQQAEEAAAIRELQKTTDDKNKAQKSAFFSFLQTQQGFAANLLGNLIPGFATKGLVGGSTPAAGQPMLAGPEDRARATADVGATRAAGVRPVQVDTTNALLRQILAALNGRHTQPPEIRHNRATGNAVADTL